MLLPLGMVLERNTEDKVNDIDKRLPLGGLFFVLIISWEFQWVGYMEKKMLREIANDTQTPKKHDFKVQNDLYERLNPETTVIDEEDWDPNGPVPLAEF